MSIHTAFPFPLFFHIVRPCLVPQPGMPSECCRYRGKSELPSGDYAGRPWWQVSLHLFPLIHTAFACFLSFSQTPSGPPILGERERISQSHLPLPNPGTRCLIAQKRILQGVFVLSQAQERAPSTEASLQSALCPPTPFPTFLPGCFGSEAG